MVERSLKRRPTWYRLAVIGAMLLAGYVATKIKDAEMGWTTGGAPFWAIPFGGALFALIGMMEMSETLSWDDRRIRMHPRWGFQYLGDKTLEVAIADLTEISAGYLSNESLDGKPFTTIDITDGITSVPIRTDNFFREGMQELVADITRLRPDLELSDNLRSYLRGEYDDIWPR